MKGVITAPKKIITGAFTILLAFIRPIELTAADVVVETLEGDALGHTKDSFGGSGTNYHILCYIPDARSGKSRISVVKDGLVVAPVIVEYDTVRTVHATWGDPVQRNRKIDIPVTLDAPVRRLRKQHFQVSEPMPCQLYGSGETYNLVVSPSRAQARFQVTLSGSVEKMNGIRADIQRTILEV